jgi:acyl carrier protein
MESGVRVDRDKVIKRLMPIMEDVFDRDDLTYADDLDAEQIEEWDSLSHIRLIVAVEKAFGLRFTTSEIEDGESLRELVDLIAAKTS